MKIFKEGNNVRLQLMDIKKGKMLFDFKIPSEWFSELKEHMIEHLNKFEV